MTTKYSNEDGSIRMTGPELLAELERMYTLGAVHIAERDALRQQLTAAESRLAEAEAERDEAKAKLQRQEMRHSAHMNIAVGAAVDLMVCAGLSWKDYVSPLCNFTGEVEPLRRRWREASEAASLRINQFRSDRDAAESALSTAAAELATVTKRAEEAEAHLSKAAEDWSKWAKPMLIKEYGWVPFVKKVVEHIDAAFAARQENRNG